MIRCFLRNAETDKSSKRQAVIQDFFKRIVGQIVPGLQKKTFEQKEYRVTRSSTWGGVNAIQTLFKRLPINKSLYFIEAVIKFLSVPEK